MSYPPDPVDIRTVRPACKYGDSVVWTGGHSRKLTLKERVLFRLGLLRTVRP